VREVPETFMTLMMFSPCRSFLTLALMVRTSHPLLMIVLNLWSQSKHLLVFSACF
jgi:hypothetical protein